MSVVPDPYLEEQKAHRWMAGASLVETVAGMVAVALASLRLREALRESSIRDPLTTLFNRRYMEARLERELRRATRARLPLSLVVCDLDQFKPLNLRYGHEAGDMVLRTFGESCEKLFAKMMSPAGPAAKSLPSSMPAAEALDSARRVNEFLAKLRREQIQFGAATNLTFSFPPGSRRFPMTGKIRMTYFARRTRRSTMRSGKAATGWWWRQSRKAHGR